MRRDDDSGAESLEKSPSIPIKKSQSIPGLSGIGLMNFDGDIAMNRLVRSEANRSPLTRWGLWDNDFDQVFENFLRPVRWIEEAAGELAPPLDVRERNDDFVITAELPGVKKEDIGVTLENGVLTISAEMKSEKEEKEGERVIRQERRFGKYVRSLRLGTQVDDKKIKANYKDGVLELVLPKAEEVKPKKIAVAVE